MGVVGNLVLQYSFIIETRISGLFTWSEREGGKREREGEREEGREIESVR